MIKPHLHEYIKPGKLSLLPEATCCEAGFLVSKNAGWRSKTPVLHEEKCVGCRQCYMYCPDGCVRKVQEGKKVAFDYDFCKGCGICARVCPVGAISMEKNAAAPL